MTIRSIRRLAFVFALVLFAGAAWAASPDDLGHFARRAGLRDIDGFVATVSTLRETGRLPDRYLTKREAESRGWRPGGDVCRARPGGAIGGDAFGNRERRLPEARGRRWFEADLDYACGRRGARRLVWSGDGLYFVTVDHYETFHRVPP